MPETAPLLRSFIAIPLSVQQKQRIATLQQQLQQLLPGLKIPKPETLHLTLLFLGEQTREQLAKVGRTMLSIGRKKKNFNVELQGLDFFPARQRPRILWLGLKPRAELIDLHRQLAVELDKQGLATEQRPYRPHLTVARFMRATEYNNQLCPFLTHSCGSLKIDRMILFSSKLTSRGAIHTPLTTVRLSATEC